MKSNQLLYLLVIVFLQLSSVKAAETVEWPHAHGMSTTELENFLATATVTSMKRTKLGITKPHKISLKKNNIEIKALFKTYSNYSTYHRKGPRSREINTADRFEYDITAYKLGQLLGLNMIPATVIRKINGKTGAVVFWIENALVYKHIHANKLKELDGCHYKKQHSIMYVFDILIYNDDRNMGNLLYTTDDCRLWLIDHSRTFRMKNGISKYLPNNKIRLSEEFAQKLRRLNYQLLEEHIGEFLNKYQINYILKRRDLILQKWKDNGSLDFQEG